MAFTRNHVEILGHVGKDPEVKTTNNGKLVVTFSIATSERYTERSSGEIVENTEWHSLVSFGRQAEIIREYVTKGSKVIALGKLKTRSWDDKDSGKKMYRTEIIVDKIGILDGKSGSDGRSPGSTDLNHLDGSSVGGEYEDVPLESVPF